MAFVAVLIGSASAYMGNPRIVGPDAVISAGTALAKMGDSITLTGQWKYAYSNLDEYPDYNQPISPSDCISWSVCLSNGGGVASGTGFSPGSSGVNPVYFTATSGGEYKVELVAYSPLFHINQTNILYVTEFHADIVTDAVVVAAGTTNIPFPLCPESYGTMSWSLTPTVVDGAVFATTSDDGATVNAGTVATSYVVRVVTPALTTCWDTATLTVITNFTIVASNRYLALSNTVTATAWTIDGSGAAVKTNSDWSIAEGNTKVEFVGSTAGVDTVTIRGIAASATTNDVKIHAVASGAPSLMDDEWFTVLKVELTNIKFNHDTGSSASDAINIRQDYNNAYDISNGEWGKGGTNIPVCYTTNKEVTIKVRFTIQPVSITSAYVWAVSTDSDGSLGDVIKTNVLFSGGVSSPEYVTMQVSGTTPNCIRKTTNDVWQWKMENVNGTGSTAYDLNTSCFHTVYTILNEPVAPWANTVGDQKNAWKTALDLVCASAPWADGEASVTGAASRITEAINGSGRFKYDIGSGAATYLDGGTIKLSHCIDRLNGGFGAGELVNCTDCGNFIMTFVNLIGGELYSSKMYTLGAGFDTNPYTAIGRPAWTPPSWGWGFSYHEVGWTGACSDGDSIFDPCLKVDGNGDPSAVPRTELMPIGLMFSDGNQGVPYVYRESLAAPGANGYGRCVAQPASKQRRPIK